MSLSPVDFMASAKAPPPMSGNSAWAAAYGNELRELVTRYANDDPRSLQRHLGPSEIGHACDRQVAAKLAHLPKTNHVLDPWASIMGRAGHTWMEGCLHWANEQAGRPRFLAEFRVTPTGFTDHPGTGDGYDADHQAVIDHKFLGNTTMADLRKNGAPRHYFVQTLLYARGFAALGLPVQRVALLAWPRTASSLDGMYVWEHVITDEDQVFLDDVIAPELAYRKQWAAALITGAARLTDVPMDTTDSCHFCPVYRPQSDRDGGYGCPGHAGA